MNESFTPGGNQFLVFVNEGGMHSRSTSRVGMWTLRTRVSCFTTPLMENRTWYSSTRAACTLAHPPGQAAAGEGVQALGDGRGAAADTLDGGGCISTRNLRTSEALMEGEMVGLDGADGLTNRGNRREGRGKCEKM
ncbi:MAG: hypothetical protein J6T94_02725 [Bacteroidaceae bacterium]|nr:hypothetical protein [Bacteroidaceae bacterium]